MMSRRDFALTLAPGVLAVTLAGCAIDPQKVADAISQGCHIAVPLTVITQIINAAAGETMAWIVNLICSSYMSSLASRKLKAGELKAGEKVDFIVHVGGQDIPVEAVVQ